eukprot:CAMPEP_0168608774 /NCGR_PEP_ID=MMETSP0449_2-20121227/826_1 /TAXON_ID=1082188 /ORGANISM="Strombidium rassoulzadegani, Strain ras09" /LENGTH=364 /DNA_ID=CAMNT_0008648821 /DNA_START=148 /DNA_END=1237 /DNA_ORIENTATION=-
MPYFFSTLSWARACILLDEAGVVELLQVPLPHFEVDFVESIDDGLVTVEEGGVEHVGQLEVLDHVGTQLKNLLEGVNALEKELAMVDHDLKALALLWVCRLLLLDDGVEVEVSGAEDLLVPVHVNVASLLLHGLLLLQQPLNKVLLAADAVDFGVHELNLILEHAGGEEAAVVDALPPPLDDLGVGGVANLEDVPLEPNVLGLEPNKEGEAEVERDVEEALLLETNDDLVDQGGVEHADGHPVADEVLELGVDALLVLVEGLVGGPQPHEVVPVALKTLYDLAARLGLHTLCDSELEALHVSHFHVLLVDAVPELLLLPHDLLLIHVVLGQHALVLFEQQLLFLVELLPLELLNVPVAHFLGLL